MVSKGQLSVILLLTLLMGGLFWFQMQERPPMGRGEPRIGDLAGSGVVIDDVEYTLNFDQHQELVGALQRLIEVEPAAGAPLYRFRLHLFDGKQEYVVLEGGRVIGPKGKHWEERGDAVLQRLFVEGGE